jgi:hypothetical protein
MKCLPLFCPGYSLIRFSVVFWERFWVLLLVLLLGHFGDQFQAH